MRYWQSQYTSPLRFTTAHQGASPKARLVEVPNDVAAVRAAIQNISFAGVFSMMSPFFGFMYVLMERPINYRHNEVDYQTAPRRACVTSFKLQASAVEFFNRPWCGKRRVSWLSGADRQTPDPGIKHRQHPGMTHARRLGRFCTGFCTGRYLAMLVQRSSVKAVRRNFVIVCPGAVIFWSNHDVASQQDK